MKKTVRMSVLVVTVLLFSGFVSPSSYGQTPSNPYKGNSSSAIDIDVTYISRTPRYDYDATKETPAVGDAVTFTAHVRSRGTSATGNFALGGISTESRRAPAQRPPSPPDPKQHSISPTPGNRETM